MDRREFVKKSSGVLLFSNFLNCSSPTGSNDDGGNNGGGNGGNNNGGNGSTTNKNPITNNIQVSYGGNGEVEYYFSGTDSDDYVDYIKVNVNGKFFEVENGSYYSCYIIKGTNLVSAIAYDNKGKSGNNKVHSFYSFTEIEARIIIEKFLSNNQDKYSSLEKNVLMSPDVDKNFKVDFLIKKKDGKDVIIDYIGYDEDLKKQLDNLDSLKWLGIPTLSLVRFPEDEININLNRFIGNGFK